MMVIKYKIYKHMRVILLHIYIQPHITMIKTIFVIICLEIFAPSRADDLLGKGLWSLISASECSDVTLTKEIIKCEVNKHKLNRTQDGISAHVTLTEELNESYGIFIDVCKFVDGGCKQYQVISDNLGKLCDKYARENVVNALKKGNFNTEYLPVQEGEYDLEDFIFDYCALPSDCPYGTYEAVVFFLYNQERIFCVKLVIECKKCEDDEDCCDDREEK